MSIGLWLFWLLITGFVIVELILWKTDRQTVTRWHIETIKEVPKKAVILLLGWGALIGHLFL